MEILRGVKIGAGTHKRLADVPFKITSKTTGESHIVVTDDNGQFSTSSKWASHKHIPMLEKLAKMVYGLEHLNQMIVKVHCFMILT